MTFRLQPLFFLPRAALIWAYRQAQWERLLDTPAGLLFTVTDSTGIWFSYRGDEVLWLWPWRREGRGAYVSVCASGNAEFGDVHFSSLKEMDEYWSEVGEAFTRMDAVQAEMGAAIQSDYDDFITGNMLEAFRKTDTQPRRHVEHERD